MVKKDLNYDYGSVYETAQSSQLDYYEQQFEAFDKYKQQSGNRGGYGSQYY